MDRKNGEGKKEKGMGGCGVIVLVLGHKGEAKEENNLG